MKNNLVVSSLLLVLALALPLAQVAQAAAPSDGTPPAYPPNTVADKVRCDPTSKDGACNVLFYTSVATLKMTAINHDGIMVPQDNLYICGVDSYKNGNWMGRLEQDVYGSWGWGIYNVEWKLTGGNRSYSSAAFNYWTGMNGPTPTVPWNTITLYQHVDINGWLLPIMGQYWTDEYFTINPNEWVCTGG